MALNKEEEQLLKEIYKRLDNKLPLPPGHPLYEPVYGHADSEDPVALMKTHIEWQDFESIQMFSGFRGSGKSTELLRLKSLLEEQGYIVLYANALNYISPAEEIDISDLLIVLAGAFSDALQNDLKIDIATESYWTRFRNYLTNTNASLSEAGVSAELDSPAKEVLGGVKAGLNLKMALKTAPSFRQNLQKFLANRIGELKEDVDSFIKDGVKKVRDKLGAEKKIVFIVDALEQIQGSLSNEQSVLRSVERLFADHLSMLNLPQVHAVYTVPPWLQFVMPNAVDNIVILPSVRQWNNDPDRSPYEAGWNKLRSLAIKRFTVKGYYKFFGETDAQSQNLLFDRLIGMCGGHFRDLLRLLSEAVIRTRAVALPVSSEIVELAISSVRNHFFPIAIEDARWLHKIEQSRKTVLLSVRSEDVSRLTRFLDTHFVLYLKNGAPWYDIHPLIREEVAELIEKHGDGSTQSG